MLNICTYLFQLIEQDEVGKILSLLAVFAHLTKLVSSSIFGVIYRGTLEDAPSTIYYVIAATYFIYACLMFIVDFKVKKMQRSETTEEKQRKERNLL